MTVAAGNEKSGTAKGSSIEEASSVEISTNGNGHNGRSNSYAAREGGYVPRGEGSRGDRDGGSREGRGGQQFYQDRAKAGAMEVIVEHNIEKAMRILKRKLIKEGLFKELKSRRYYEKPSERKKRKEKESKKKQRKEEARAKKTTLV